MGFDVLYLPPIHPIGRVNRKGRNNALVAGDDDVGSPWAIGAEEGGHDAIHPRPRHARRLPRASSRRPPSTGSRWRWTWRCSARRTTRGSPSTRSGSPPAPTARIAYAENPPKKYQDIYPLNFDNDPEGIRAEILRVVLHWVGAGRQDLPGGQPAHQAGRLLALADRGGQGGRPRRAVPGRGVHPAGDDARPRHGRLHPVVHLLHLADVGLGDAGVLRGAGRLGRPHAAQLLAQHARHPARDAPARRPADVQDPRGAGQHAHRRRGACTPATSCSSTWPRPGAEEYLDNEKFQLRPRDWAGAEAAGRSLAGFLTRLNAIRRDNPALHWLRNLRFHEIDNPAPAVLVQARPADRQHRPRHLLVRLERRAVGQHHAGHAGARASTGTSGSW